MPNKDLRDWVTDLEKNNQLQIAINQGKASKLLGLKLHEIIRIEFK